MLMRTGWTNVAGLAAACVGVLVLSAGEQTQENPQQARARESSALRPVRAVDEILAGWTKEAREPAEKIIAKYGEPAEMTENMLIWHRKAPWKHIIAYREPVPHNFPMPHKDLIEMFIDARVPPDKFDELAQFDGSVVCARTKGEISARCDKEEMNFLALNLAQDIVNGQKTVEEARRVYAHTALAFTSGEKDPLTQGFRTQPPTGTTADPDQPAAEKPEEPAKPKEPAPK